jgi:hypothetical protein
MPETPYSDTGSRGPSQLTDAIMILALVASAAMVALWVFAPNLLARVL